MAGEIKSREDLYSAVWSKPMMNLAEEFGMSGRGLAKLCERLKVPVPPRGYWRKIDLGQKIKTTPLPKVDYSRYELWKNQSCFNDLERRRKTEKERAEIFEKPELVVRDKEIQEIVLRTLHEEKLRNTRVILSEQESTNPLVKKFLHEHGYNKHSSSSSNHGRKLDIDVTENCALRAALLMETLLQGFIERKWNFCIEENDSPYSDRMFVCLFGQKIYITLFEHVTNKRISLTEEEIREFKKENPY